MVRIKTVQQKTFLCSDVKSLDVTCNQFRLNHPKYSWKGTTVTPLFDGNQDYFAVMATIFWEEYVEVKE